MSHLESPDISEKETEREGRSMNAPAEADPTPSSRVTPKRSSARKPRPRVKERAGSVEVKGREEIEVLLLEKRVLVYGY